MKTKYFIFAALAGMTFAGCSSDDFIAETPPVNNVDEGMVPILFTSQKNNFTRADIEGAKAAELLGNKFVVFGYKGAIADSKKTGAPGATVFDNYLVEYAENTAHTTESNSDNWEYVGKGVIQHAKDNGITQQTIKYWDYSADQYDFIAWSTGGKTAVFNESELAAGKVYVTEIKAEAAASPATGLGTAYTFTGEAEDLKDCYIADLVTVYKKAKESTVTDPTYNVVWKGYQQPVTLRFRQLGTKVRIGIYETVPGYSVRDVKFYSAAANALTDNDDTDASARIFTTQENGINKEGSYTVTFPTVDKPTDADNNQAHIAFAGKPGAAQKTTIEWGTMDYTIRESGESSEEAIYLGRTSNTATFANKEKAEQNYYEVFLPNEAGTNLNLRVNYTLESIDGSKETIVVKGATAQVPSIYTTWKPGYAYTYLFKISDKTNGHTGVYDPTKPDDTTVNSDPAGLYPITFDAIVVNAEDGDKTQETITLVSTPSITTYQNGSNVVNNNEYTVLTTSTDKPEITGEIYVTVNDGEISYEEVTPVPTAGQSVIGYYTKTTVDGNDVYTLVKEGDNTTVGDGTTLYYRMKPIVENGSLATLTSKAKLYTLPAALPTGRTAPWSEAEVISALQTRDDDAADGTVKGRSGLVLTEAKDGDNLLLKLTNEVTYGVDGNTINVSTGQAAKFIPTANTTYAFVYTKTAPTAENDKDLYEAKTFAVNADVNGYYRYAYKNATCTDDKGTTEVNDDVYDAKKGVKYFSKDANDVYTQVTAFIGQSVSNAYIKVDNKYVIASGYAVTGTEYYYTTDGGRSYTMAHNEAYSGFSSDVNNEKIYTFNGTSYDKVSGITTPAENTAYYYKDGENYYWCIFLPQQTKEWFELDETTKVACGDSEKAIEGQTYFDKYTVNDGVYYTKIIKVAPAN